MTLAAMTVTVQVSFSAKSLDGSRVYVVGPPLPVAAREPLAQVMSYQAPDTVTGSEKLIEMFASSATLPAPDDGVVEATDGPTSPTPCEPRPLNVSVAKPPPSALGSKMSEPLPSPVVIESLRRSVLSAVLARPLPHSVPGSKPT